MDPHLSIRSTDFVHGPRGGRVPRRSRRPTPGTSRPMSGRATAAIAGGVVLFGTTVVATATLVLG